MAESKDIGVGKFYNDLQTVPKLVSDLALSIAEAQRRMDQDYLENLAQFVTIIAEVGALSSPPGSIDTDRFLSLFRAMAPSRYQFTETVLEVRADLQMGRQEDIKGEVNLGIKAAVFALAINASYARRTAYDAHASALIRTTLNAVPADPAMVDKLLPRAGEIQHAQAEPLTGRYRELAEAFKSLMGLLPSAPITSP